VRHVAETGSTNSDVAAAAAAGEPEGLVIVADHQTAGRGRLGRRWVAEPGSALLASILLRPTSADAQLAVAAVACAASAVTGAGIKWPNDLVAPDNRKLAGVLAESGGNGTWVVVGIGVNLRDVPPDVPDAIALSSLRDDVPSRDAFLEQLLGALEPRYAAIDAVPAEYRNRCVTIGRDVRVVGVSSTFEGVAVSVDDAGGLVVRRADGEVVTVTVGDVVHLRAS